MTFHLSTWTEYGTMCEYRHIGGLVEMRCLRCKRSLATPDGPEGADARRWFEEWHTKDHNSQLRLRYRYGPGQWLT